MSNKTSAFLHTFSRRKIGEETAENGVFSFKKAEGPFRGQWGLSLGKASSASRISEAGDQNAHEIAERFEKTKAAGLHK